MNKSSWSHKWLIQHIKRRKLTICGSNPSKYAIYNVVVYVYIGMWLCGTRYVTFLSDHPQQNEPEVTFDHVVLEQEIGADVVNYFIKFGIWADSACIVAFCTVERYNFYKDEEEVVKFDCLG